MNGNKFHDLVVGILNTTTMEMLGILNYQYFRYIQRVGNLVLDRLGSHNNTNDNNVTSVRNSINYKIRQIKEEDISHGRFLEVLESLPLGGLTKPVALSILKDIKSNPLHKIFVAVIQNNIEFNLSGNNDHRSGLVIGTTTLLVEPKFIFSGGRVGHLEDVAVRKGYERKGIGSRLVRHATKIAKTMGCVRTILNCSDQTMSFYERLGYVYQDNCMSI
ncbi:MAG TPA: GNAT family N-acetyltransferase [Candidatus Bathyarchaeia archaeon]|nr:GNAT family N-acetyltransferase [Candidatus Bathyarchaeia archaeon]